MKSKELERYMEKLFKILFLIEGYLQTCSFTFGKKIISFFLWPTIILGIIILIYRVIEYRKFYNDKKIIILSRDTARDFYLSTFAGKAGISASSITSTFISSSTSSN